MKRNGTRLWKRVALLTFALVIAACSLCGPNTAEAMTLNSIKNEKSIHVFKDWNGVILHEETEAAIGVGVSGYDKSIPTRPSDELYNYTFSGWKKSVSYKRQGLICITTHTYIAQYTATPKDPNLREIIWKNQDGYVLKKEYVRLGNTPVWDGDAPEKAADARNDYTFSGWSPDVVAVTDHATYTAEFTSTPAKYTVTWKNQDGTVLKTAQNVEYDAIPAYDGETPVLNSTAQYTYVFDRWEKQESMQGRTISFTARYLSTINRYAIIWQNADGTELKIDQADYGSVPSYAGQTPSRASDDLYSYTFSGWTPAVAKVTGASTYTAAYTAAFRNDFTVTWKNWDGTVLETDHDVCYGTAPEYNGLTPEKASDERCTYTFLDWTPEMTDVTGNMVYTASFLPTARSYTVTWKDWDGTVLETEEYGWSSMPSYPGNDPERESDALWRYRFSGWNPEITSVAQNMEYTAQYAATPNEYALKFREEDGITAIAAIPDQTVAYGETAQIPDYTPTKEGYRFIGWAHSGEIFDLSAPMTGVEDSVIILTPVFSKLYTVSASHAATGGNGEGSVTWQSETAETTDQEIQAIEGEHIIITAVPAEGSALSSFLIRCLNDEQYADVPYVLTKDNTAEFDMPSGEVVISARFMLNDDVLDEMRDENSLDLFHVRSESDLVLLSQWNKTHDMAGQTIQLDADLNMAGVRFEGFSGAFSGAFIGGGHTVRNIRVYGTASLTTQRVGFFWDLQGSVSGLTLTGSVSDVARRATGGLAGNLQNGGSVSNCTAIMQADDALVCINWGGNNAVSDCWYAGSESQWGTPLYIIEASSDGNTDQEAVISDTSCAGLKTIGGIQYFPAGSTVTLTLTAPETVGQYTLAGFIYDEDDSHYLAWNADHTYAIPAISEDLTIQPDYRYQMGLDYQDGKYLVRSRSDLEAVARAVKQTSGCGDMTFRLTNDIDFNGAAFSGIAVGTDSSFYGTFDGGGHTIRNMVIASSASNVGFIGQLGGSLRQLTLENCTVIGTENAAMLAGGGWGGTVQGCRVLGGKVQAEQAGAVYLDDYTNYNGGTDNLYDTNVAVVSGGTVVPSGKCGTSTGDRTYAGSDAASVMWTVSFLSEENGVAMAAPQKVANRNAAQQPEVTALPLREHASFTGSWQRADGTVYTFQEHMDGDLIDSDTILYAIWEDEETCEILLTDGQENGQSRTVSAYLSETAGWTLPECSFAPAEGMTFDCWEYEGLTYAPDDTVALGSERVLTARWKWIPHSIFSQDGENTEEIDTAHYTEEYVFMVVPDPGLRVESVTCISASGQIIPVTGSEEDGMSYSIVMPNEDVTLSTTSALEEYTIETVGLENGALFVNGSPVDLTKPITVHYADEITVTSNTGWLLESLEVKDAVLEPVEAENGSFLMPDIHVTITAVIVENLPVFSTPDFTLPAFLTEVETEAFEGIATVVVEVPASCRSIGDRAFRNCPNLTQIRIPAGCELGTDVFDGCTRVYVFGTAGSSAEAYCLTHGNCVFVPVE